MARPRGRSAGECLGGLARAAALLGLLGALNACALVEDLLPGGGEPAGGPAAGAAGEPEPGFEGLAYAVEITGLSDEQDDLAAVLRDSARLVTLRERPPATLAGLERRAEADLERLRTALRSEGYYAGEVTFELDESVEPVKVALNVVSGPRYSLGAYEIGYAEPAPPPAVQPDPADLGLSLGNPARAPEIVAAETRLLDRLARRGYPLGEIRDRRTLVNHAERRMTVRLTVAAGPAVRFGPATIEGLSDVEADYVRKLITWREGEIYDRGAVEATRSALSETGLFDSVVVRSAGAPNAEGELPMTLALSEGAQRSIGFGANYSSGEGFGGELFWEHRNFFGRNERLRLDLTVAQIEQSFAADLRKPYFLAPDQTLLSNLELANRNTDAFDEQSVTGFLGLERPWQEHWRLSAGTSAEYDILDDAQGERAFTLLGLPLTATRDDRDDLLDPSRGTLLTLTVTPYGGAGDQTLIFLRSTLGGAAYYAIDDARRFVVAGRARLGSLVGNETEELPANKRFYAGGGGSIRGYEFQKVGPLDASNEPLGGRSLIELGLELRVRVTEEIGIVPFLDGGSVFDSPYPDFEEDLRWAAGLGLRYFTAIGPLRLDIAVPLDKRDGIDDDYQFYISLGQAF